MQKKIEMDAQMFTLGEPLISTLQHLINFPEEDHESKNISEPTITYVRDAWAMTSTPADVKELHNAYSFVIDMPGVKSGDIKVQVEDDNVLVISGERKREHCVGDNNKKEEEKNEKEKEEVKCFRMEWRMGKFMRKFSLPENADVDGITAECKDGVLTVNVKKKLPPEPKTIKVQVT